MNSVNELDVLLIYKYIMINNAKIKSMENFIHKNFPDIYLDFEKDFKKLLDEEMNDEKFKLIEDRISEVLSKLNH